MMVNKSPVLLVPSLRSGPAAYQATPCPGSSMLALSPLFCDPTARTLESHQALSLSSSFFLPLSPSLINVCLQN